MKIFIIIIAIAIIGICLAVYFRIKNWNPKPCCHVCGGETEIEWVCDKCNEFYCDNCSAPFTYHNQIDFPCCEFCGNIYYD